MLRFVLSLISKVSQSSQTGRCSLRWPLPEDVDSRTEGLHPVAEVSDIEIGALTGLQALWLTASV